MFSFKNINKKYNQRYVLNHIHIDIERGETAVILGKNGAGKSTLLKILGGAIKNDSKLEISIDQKQIRYSSPFGARKFNIESIYQTPLFIDCMSIWRNFFLFHEPLKFNIFLKCRMMQRAVVQEMERLGMGNINPNDNISVLSGGEKQCLAIARSLYQSTELLLLDEPTSALEEKQRLNLINFLKDAQKKRGISIIMITHSRKEAILLGDSIYFLENSKLIEIEKSDLIKESTHEL